MPKADLLLYIAALESTLSIVLMEERTIKGTAKQVPIYFVSEALSGSKLLYLEMEKLAYSTVMEKRKLRQYFEAHRIIIPTSYPLKDIVRNRESSPRIAKWAVELAEYTIEFVPLTAANSQVLADFVANWTPGPKSVAAPIQHEVWEIQCDGAYCDKGAGASEVITSPSGLKL